MATIQWLLQKNHPDLPAIREIEAILHDQGNDFHIIALLPRSRNIPDIEGLDTSRPVVCYGPSFVPRAFGHKSIFPGIFFDPERFRWSAFRQGWGDLMISRNAMVTRAANAAAHIGAGMMFVRPDEDSKVFDGGLFDKASLGAVIARAIERAYLDADTPVVIAGSIEIEAEWRTFIVGGDVVAASSYRKDGASNVDLHVPHRVIDLAFEAAARWAPAEVFCLDIARAEGRYGIVEANCFNASRFYGADAKVVLASVSSFVGETYGS